MINDWECERGSTVLAPGMEEEWLCDSRGR